MPRLINLRKEIPPEENFALIDRRTPFGNPFRIGIHGTRDEVIAKHAEWFANNKSLQEKVEKELRGKDLGCWCYPNPCHGATYLRFLYDV